MSLVQLQAKDLQLTIEKTYMERFKTGETQNLPMISKKKKPTHPHTLSSKTVSAISSQYQVREFLLRTVLPVIYRLGVISGGPFMFSTVTALSHYFWRSAHSH